MFLMVCTQERHLCNYVSGLQKYDANSRNITGYIYIFFIVPPASADNVFLLLIHMHSYSKNQDTARHLDGHINKEKKEKMGKQTKYQHLEDINKKQRSVTWKTSSRIQRDFSDLRPNCLRNRLTRVPSFVPVSRPDCGSNLRVIK